MHCVDFFISLLSWTGVRKYGRLHGITAALGNIQRLFSGFVSPCRTPLLSNCVHLQVSLVVCITARSTWTHYKTYAQIAKELKVTPILDKLLGYERNWIKHVNRMPRNRLPSVMKHYSPTGRRNHSRPLKRLLDT